MGKLKNIRRIGMFGSVFLLLAGCASQSSPKAEKTLEVVPENVVPAARKLAVRYAAGMADALRGGDYARLAEVLPPEYRGRFSKETFEKMRARLLKQRGRLLKTAYVTELNHSVVRDFVWKFTFEWPSGRQQEGWYFIRTALVEGTPKVVGAGFSFLTPPGFNKSAKP